MKVTSIHYLKFKGGKKKSFVPYITLIKNKIATGLGALNMIHSLVIPSVYRQVPRKRKKKEWKIKGRAANSDPVLEESGKIF